MTTHVQKNYDEIIYYVKMAKSGAKKSASKKSGAKKSASKRSSATRRLTYRSSEDVRVDLSSRGLRNITWQDLMANTVKDMRAFARRHKVRVSGTKPVLARRILSFSSITPSGASWDELTALSKSQLQAIARDNGLRTSGNKNEIVTSILMGRKGRPRRRSSAKRSPKRSPKRSAKRSASR